MSARVLFAILGFLVFGCASNPTLELLPATAGGTAFPQVNVINESFRSGHAVDDVFDALGKTRADGVAVSRFAPATRDEIGAVRVNSVPGEQLLAAFVQAWRPDAVINRTTEVIDGRTVSVLGYVGGAATIAYQRDDVVLYAYSDAPERARSFIADLP
jgi:hypothetical protein